MIKPSDLSNIVYNHDQWVSTQREKWRRYRAAYEDRFWDRHQAFWRQRFRSDLYMEVNLIRPWVESYVASLFYKGIRTVVAPDDVRPEEIPSEMSRSSEAVSAVLDRFLATRHASELTEQAFTMGMLYPESAFKVGIDPTDDSPLESVYMEIMPPWECVWDRQARSKRSLRYIGHIYYDTVENVSERFGISPKKLHPVAKPDVVEDGLHGTTGVRRQMDYVRLLEFYDYTANHKVDGVETSGEFRVYLVDKGESDNMSVLFKGPIPFTKFNGQPMAPIVPIVLINVPEYPLQGIAPVGTLYELNSELNVAHTFMARAFRRDVSRVLLYLKDRGLDDETIEQIMAGDDWAMAGVEADSLDGMMKWVDQQPVSPTLFQYMEMLKSGREETQGTAPFSRGTPLNYATATEVVRLNDYTETTLGRLRKRMDAVLIEVCGVYLRVLQAAMSDDGLGAVFVNGGSKVHTVRSTDLDMRWEVTIADMAGSPVAEQQRRLQFTQVQPILMNLAQLADQPGMTGSMAKAQLRYAREVYDLPEDFRFDILQGAAEDPTTQQVDQAAVQEMEADPELQAALKEVG